MTVSARVQDVFAEGLRPVPERDVRIVRVARLPAEAPDAGARIAAAMGSDVAQIFVFASPRADFAALSAALGAACGDIPVAACTTAGEIDHGFRTDAIVALGLPAAEFRTQTVLVDDLSRIDTDAVVADMIRARRSLDPVQASMPYEFAFLLVDGTSQREDDLMDAISHGLGPVPLFGGSAGDGTDFRLSLLSLNGTVMTGAAVLVFARSACPVRVFSFDHLEPGETRMVVTAAEPARRRVTEINAAPAAPEYARILGKDPDDLDGFTFAAHPLVVRVGGRYFVRSIQRVGADRDLFFFSAIDEGVVLTLADTRDIAGALSESLGEIAGAGEIDTVLACDCILRRIEAQQKQRTGAVSEVLARHNVVGFSTYGEQFGAMHVNLTMTGIAIFRPPTEET